MKILSSAFIVKRQLTLVLLIMAVTLVAGYTLTRIKIGNSLLEAFVGSRHDFERYIEHSRQFGGDGDNLVYLGFQEGPELFTKQKLNSIRSAAIAIEQIDEVASVSCLPDAPNSSLPQRQSIRMIARKTALRRKLASGTLPDTDEMGKMKVKAYWPNDAAQQDRIQMASLKKGMLGDPLLKKTLISEDGFAHCMVVQLHDASLLTAPRQIRLREQLNAICDQYELGADGSYEAGIVMWQSWLFQELTFGLTVLTPLGLLVTVGVVYLYFGRVIVSLLIGVVSCLANIWAIAATAAVFGSVTALVAAVPLVILVVSTSDIVHFAAAYQKKRERGVSHTEALKAMVSEVGSACIVASATTFIGFVSLATVPVPATRQFAVASAFGVFAALILSLLIAPIAFHRWPPAARENEPIFVNRFRGFVQCLVQRCRLLVTLHPWQVVLSCGVITAFLIWAASRCELYSDFPSRFGKTHPVRRSSDFFDRQFLGSSTMEVFINQEDPLAPRSLRQQQDIVLAINEADGVRHVFGLLDILHTIDRTVGFKTDDGLPPSAKSAAASLRFSNALGGLDYEQFYNDKHELRLIVSCTADDFLTAERTANAIREAVEDTVDIQVTGTFVLVGNAVREVIQSQTRGFAICCLAIGIVFIVVTGSIRRAAWAVLPNLVPLLAMGGAVGVTLRKMDADVLGLPVVALGLAVDDTIHFLHRFQLERKKGQCRNEALCRTYEYSGTAVIMTTFILCCGLLPCLGSNYLSVWMLGSFLVISLATAVVADMLLLPAFIKLGRFDDPD